MAETKRMFQPEAFQALLDKLADAVGDHVGQADAGRRCAAVRYLLLHPHDFRR